MEKRQYFIALVPNTPYAVSLMELKTTFSEKFNTKAALKSPPHLTLHMPFKKEAKEEDKIIQILKDAAKGFSPFKVKLKNFGAFPPKVIYVGVEENAELRLLQKSVAKHTRVVLQQFNDTHRNRGFHPHITVAFRDLKKAEFAKAWEEYSNELFESYFMASDLCLLKHNGEKWEVYKRIPLEG